MLSGQLGLSPIPLPNEASIASSHKSQLKRYHPRFRAVAADVRKFCEFYLLAFVGFGAVCFASTVSATNNVFRTVEFIDIRG